MLYCNLIQKLLNYDIMTSITLVLRPSIRKGRYLGSLYCRLIHGREAKTVIIASRCLYPEEWNKERQEIIYPINTPRRYMQLQTLERTITEETERLTNYIAMLEQKGMYTTSELVTLYRKKSTDGKLLCFTKTLSTTLKENKQYRLNEAYLTVTKGLVDFNRGVDIPLSQINGTLIKKFETHLYEIGRSQNTISYYMRNLCAIFNKAIKENLVIKPNESPFSNVFKGVHKTIKRALTTHEMQLLTDLNFAELINKTKPKSKKRVAMEELRHAWLYLIFCFCAQGMCFIDLSLLKKENIKNGYLIYMRKKTHQRIEVQITPEMQTIINLFKAETAGSDYLFPILCDNNTLLHRRYASALRSQNNRMKKLAKLAGVEQSITTHWVRHTWASIGKAKSIPIPVIGECLGHTSEKTTLIYIDSLDNSVKNEANRAIIRAAFNSTISNRLSDVCF